MASTRRAAPYVRVSTTGRGQTIESHSISAGLDYPGVGPAHAWLNDTGRATYEPVRFEVL